MPKFRNIKSFARPMTVNGKRIIVKPNDVIFSERDLDLKIYDFLQKVDDKVEATQIKEIPLKQISVPKVEEVKQIKTSLETVKKEVQTLQTSSKDISDLNEKINTILKRMEILKTAIESVAISSQEALDLSKETASAVHDLETEVYENGGIVITGLDDEEKKGN